MDVFEASVKLFSSTIINNVLDTLLGIITVACWTANHFPFMKMASSPSMLGAQPVVVGPMPPLQMETQRFFSWILDEVFLVDIGCLSVVSPF